MTISNLISQHANIQLIEALSLVHHSHARTIAPAASTSGGTSATLATWVRALGAPVSSEGGVPVRAVYLKVR